MSSNTKSQSKDSSPFSGLPLPQFQPVSTGGGGSTGGNIHQKPQKYPERSIKISIEDDFSYNNNVTSAPTLIKMGFLRKVYGILTVQLLSTVLVCLFFMTHQSSKVFIQNNQWLVLLCAFATFGVLMGLHVNRKKFPMNFFLLAAFTILESVVLGSMVTFFETELVFQAFVLTMSVTMLLTVYACQTKVDFTNCGATLLVCLWILILAPIFQLVFNSGTYEIVLCFGGVTVFGFFIIFDTQMIMNKVSPEEYVVATIELYLDIINLFIYILRILKETRRN